MDFDCAVKTINRLLREKQPDTFNSSWIRQHAPGSYRYIKKNVRAQIGGIDWDRVTRALDRKYQNKWKPSYRISATAYREKSEVSLILHKYRAKLYAVISPADKNDEHVRDIICIALVRTAQKGNVLAKEEIVKLVRFIIDEWIETRPTLSSWEGNESLIEKRIEACIRCYRYSGTFIGYLFKTLEYAGRGLRLINTYSLDDSFYLKQ
jgi:hypothetical protein